MQNKGSLHNKFKDFGAQPSENLWDSIASNLDERKKKRIIIFWWVGSGLAAVFILSLLVINTNGINYIKSTNNKIKYNERENHSTLAIQTTIDSNVIINAGLSNVIENDLNTDLNLSYDDQNFDEEKVTKLGLSSNTKDLEIAQSQVSTNGNNIESKDFKLVENLYSDVDKICIPIFEKIELKKNSNLAFSDIDQPKSKSKLSYSFRIQNQKGFELYQSQPYSEAEVLSTNNVGAEFDLLPEPSIQKFRPLTVRFGIAKKLNKRLSFQTGIDLGWIQTNSSISKSSLFTIGIPLKLNLSLIERKRGMFYTDFGLVNEFPFFERTQTFDGYGLNQFKLETGFLGGTEIGLGYNYKLNEKIKFDVNSGFKWYYYQSVKSGTQIATQNGFINFSAGVIWNY